MMEIVTREFMMMNNGNHFLVSCNRSNYDKSYISITFLLVKSPHYIPAPNFWQMETIFLLDW